MITKDLRRKIESAFLNEYIDKTRNDYPALFEKSKNEPDENFERAIFGVLGGPVFVGCFLSFGIFPAIPVIVIGVVALGCIYQVAENFANSATRKIEKYARRDIKRDIDNKRLLARYRDEIVPDAVSRLHGKLVKEMECREQNEDAILRREVTLISQELSAKESFDNAAASRNESAVTQANNNPSSTSKNNMSM